MRNGTVATTLDGKRMSLKTGVPGVITYPRNAGEPIPSDLFYACLDLKEAQAYPWMIGEGTRYYDNFQDSAKAMEFDSGVDVVVTRVPSSRFASRFRKGRGFLRVARWWSGSNISSRPAN